MDQAQVPMSARAAPPESKGLARHGAVPCGLEAGGFDLDWVFEGGFCSPGTLHVPKLEGGSLRQGITVGEHLAHRDFGHHAGTRLQSGADRPAVLVCPLVPVPLSPSAAWASLDLTLGDVLHSDYQYAHQELRLAGLLLSGG